MTTGCLCRKLRNTEVLSLRGSKSSSQTDKRQRHRYGPPSTCHVTSVNLQRDRWGGPGRGRGCGVGGTIKASLPFPFCEDLHSLTFPQSLAVVTGVKSADLMAR